MLYSTIKLDFDIEHLPGIVQQATYALSSLETTNADETEMDDEVPGMAIFVEGVPTR